MGDEREMMDDEHELTDEDRELMEKGHKILVEAQEAVKGGFKGKDLEDLIAALEKVKLAYIVDKDQGTWIAVAAAHNYLSAQGVPGRLLVPLNHLLGEIGGRMPDSQKTMNEAQIMAMAAAAVTLGSPGGKTKEVDKACKDVATALKEARFRVMEDQREWGWKALKNHRAELINERASAHGNEVYRNWIGYELQDAHTPKEKMDFILTKLTHHI